MIKIDRVIGGELEANCWIIHHGEGSEAFIIDPGYSHKKYLGVVRERGVRPEGILLTHHHHDHSGAADVLANELDIPVYLHRGDLPYYKGRVDIPLDGGETLYLAGGGDAASGGGTPSPGGNAAGGGEPSRQSGADAAAEGEPLHVLHTPGHSAGGLCFYLPDSKVSFTGDTIFNVDLGYTHFPGGSEADMRASLINVVNKWGNDVTIYPGHGDPATMKYVREANREFIDIVASA
jgi:glyoxylase-like metal-dependent hydrolase (beta-lactamase superfamily II)